MKNKYPADHPAWDEAELALVKIWSESVYVSPEEDALWLKEVRGSWFIEREPLITCISGSTYE